MPRFNGVLVYPFEVLLHLLWCYLIWGLVYLLLSTPVLVIALLTGTPVAALTEVATSWASLLAHSPTFFLACVHVLTCGSFRLCFWPRFPYAPAVLTFVVAAFFGSAIVALVWRLEEAAVSLPAAELLFAWLADRDVLLSHFVWTGVGSVAFGLFGLVIHRFGGLVGTPLAPARWFGQLFVGRAAYAAFAERETARLRREYVDTLEEIRR